MGIPSPAVLALSGRGYTLFTGVRGMGILRTSPNPNSRKFVSTILDFLPIGPWQCGLATPSTIGCSGIL
jgi:hypothetical protein